MSTDEIIDLYMVNPGFGEDITRYQTDHIRGETSPTEYSPPSCATMQSYGDCVNMDDRCETIRIRWRTTNRPSTTLTKNSLTGATTKSMLTTKLKRTPDHWPASQ